MNANSQSSSRGFWRAVWRTAWPAFILAASAGCSGRGQGLPPIENETLRLHFNAERPSLAAIENRLTGEVYPVAGDDFVFELEEYDFTRSGFQGPAVTNHTLSQRDLNLKQVKSSSREAEIQFGDEVYTVAVEYTLRPVAHFAEKRVRISSTSAFGLKRVVLGAFDVRPSGLEWVQYPYQRNVTFFGRSPKGGLFAGLEIPFDRSSLGENAPLQLAYTPNIRGVAEEPLESEPAYIGVYRRWPGEAPTPGIPLGSESGAMVAMTSQILGPPRHGLVPVVCGWWSEMSHRVFDSPTDAEADMRSIDFIARCGIDWVMDSRPWSGETEKVHSLVADQSYTPGALESALFEHARNKGVKVVFWPTLVNSNPWPEPDTVPGKPFRPDRPEWRISPSGQAIITRMMTNRPLTVFRYPFLQLTPYPLPTVHNPAVFTTRVEANCLAVRPFEKWITRIQLEGLDTGHFDGWALDGDYFGAGGIVEPVDCPSNIHDHLPGDSTYSCERAANSLGRTIRERYPRLLMIYGRPQAEMGVWSNLYIDASFSLGDGADTRLLERIGARPVNVELGDKIRTLSRTRVQRQFLPHYIDQTQVFAPSGNTRSGTTWSSEALDYILLSALASSPNQLYYLPTKAGIPGQDIATIRKWLDWGRANVQYLRVRKDLEEWPAPGKVDGFAHLLGDRGFLFLFNPNGQALAATFTLDEALGLTAGQRFQISQLHPSKGASRSAARDDKIEWTVPPRAAVLLKIAPE